MLEPDLFPGFAHVRDLERWRLALIEDGRLFHQDLDFARGQVGVGGGDLLVLLVAPVLAARSHLSANADHPLAPDLLGQRVGVFRGVRIEHDLGQPLAVAQIHEDELAVIPAVIDPTEQHDLLADVGGSQGTQVMGSFQLVDEAGHGLLLGSGEHK